jgi:hypothetical protein
VSDCRATPFPTPPGPRLALDRIERDGGQIPFDRPRFEQDPVCPLRTRFCAPRPDRLPNLYKSAEEPAITPKRRTENDHVEHRTNRQRPTHGAQPKPTKKARIAQRRAHVAAPKAKGGQEGQPGEESAQGRQEGQRPRRVAKQPQSSMRSNA